jgi:uncharacterized protein (TIGR03437 family)
MATRWAAVLVLVTAAGLTGQILNNQTLAGNYFFRHLLFTTDDAGNIVDIRSLWGKIQFDGEGSYSFSGQSGVATAAPVALGGNGSYAVSPAGVVTLANPQQSSLTLNARWGSVTANEGMLVGSSTEGAANTFDLLVAIQAPASALSTSLTGGYWVSTLAFPFGSAALVSSSQFELQANGQGVFDAVTVNGHSANVSLGQPVTQAIVGATYAVGSTGSLLATFPLQSGFDATTQLVSGNKTIYFSANGNVILGGSSDGSMQDIFVGFLAGRGVAWSQYFWNAGLRFETTGSASAYAGSLYADGASNLTFTRREHQLQPAGAATYDFTGAETFALGNNGVGTAELTSVAVGAGGAGFAGTAENASDAAGYEVYLGMPRPALSGAGVFLNPLGVLNGAGFAPAIDSICPGEYVALQGTNLAPSTEAVEPPYPDMVAGVSVMINDVPAPVRSISPTLLYVLVPDSTTGSTATVVVNNNGTASNAVQVPVEATAPAVFSLNGTGIGPAAVLHLDYSIVTAANPAKRGEIVSIYLTGLGAVTPMVTDGAAGETNPLSVVTAPVNVLVGGQPATILFQGLAPDYPGLYVMNVVVPADLNVTAAGPFPLAIQTADSFHDQVDLMVGL